MGMIFRQFAYNNVVRNKRTHLAYFLSSSFSVMIFFTYALLLFHPDLQGELASTSGTLSTLATMGMKISQYLIFIFSFFFLLYSVSAFLKTRKKEFAVLLVLGMSPRQMNRLVFIENMMIGIASIVVGIAAGLVFSKLTLLISANLLVIEKGLSFYIPIQAVWTTAGSFLLLFLLISLFTTRMGKRGSLLELLKSEEKPKPEPQASVWLSVLAVVLIGSGYGMVFYFVLGKVFSMVLLSTGVVLVVVGTYFLFTQLSVYVIRALKKNERLFFRKTNLLTLSELTYRMKDNAIMFCMVSIISASAFTGIGTCLALGKPGLAAMSDPYAFTYRSSQGNTQAEKHVSEIQNQLNQASFPYKMGTMTPKYSDNGTQVVKLSDFNSMALARGFQTVELNDQEVILAPTNVIQMQSFKKKGEPESLLLQLGKSNISLQVQKSVPYIILPIDGDMIVISDSLYDKLETDNFEPTYYRFVVEHWEKSREVAQTLQLYIPEDREGHFHLTSLVFTWISGKQTNGILMIMSVLVGIVFFTFAASFLYFRLYADLERDQKQYQMISKVGLSRSELNVMVTRQLLLMFFLPISLALIHSGVAFAALQQLIDFSIVGSSILVFVSFVSVQVMYFALTRWRYLNRLYQNLV
jgi:putative ABC transport system permease protein